MFLVGCAGVAKEINGEYKDGTSKAFGDFYIAQGAKLALNGKTGGVSKNGCLEVEGDAEGSGDLLVAEARRRRRPD